MGTRAACRIAVITRALISLLETLSEIHSFTPKAHSLAASARLVFCFRRSDFTRKILESELLNLVDYANILNWNQGESLRYKEFSLNLIGDTHCFFRVKI